MTDQPNPAETLPIHAHRDEIIETIAAHQVTVVQGDTGSGKSTQLPKFCLAMGRGGEGRLIGHTQPRRVAARSVATRIATELGEARKNTVGYKVRFTDHTSRDTRIKLMTDGILLAEIQGDRRLKAYDTLILDEVHERSLTIDFLLGYLKRLLPQRPDLKLILASATIDAERFSRHFDHAPIIAVSGRAFPVEVHYWPLPDPERKPNPEQAAEAAADQAVVRSTAIPEAVPEAIRAIVLAPGRHFRPESIAGSARDILVFLSGEQEIRETAELLRKRPLPNTDVLPLFGRMEAKSQDRIFAPHTRRHVVLATNIAETSLTVPGIRFVVDAGGARISRYSHQARVQRLPIEPISQASANQRKGRCGRVAPGVCIRLYSEEDFASRPPFTEPEIRRTNLATVILRMKALGLGDIEKFPFLDKPDRRYIADGIRLLRELGVLDGEERLNRRGRQLARLPVDPRIGRMVLAGAEEGCLAEVLIIASALSIPDPRESSREGRDAREQALEARAGFRDGKSDFTELLRIWAYYREKRRELSANQLQKRCRKNFLSYLRMREWQELHHQLTLLAKGMDLPIRNEAASYARIHRALLTGLLGHVGYHSGEKTRNNPRDKRPAREYTGARNTRFLIGRGSVLHKSQPKWVMAAELVRTSHTYAHGVARIRPEWIERVGREHIKTTWFDAHWDEERGEVMAYERRTLYGLTIIPGRKIPYAQVNPPAAREIFIESFFAFDEVGEPQDTRNPAEEKRLDRKEKPGKGGTKAGRESEEQAKAASCSLARREWARKRSLQGVNEHSEPIPNAAREHDAAFAVHNRGLIAHLREMERRSRRPDSLVDAAALYRFYDERVPPHVTGRRAFAAWRKTIERAEPERLFLSPRDLCDPAALEKIQGAYPDVMVIRDHRLPLSYRFDPGDIPRGPDGGGGEKDRDRTPNQTLDGVTVTILQNALYQLDPGPFQWLAPGLLEEKILALFRALPKPLRRTLPPVAETARNSFREVVSGFAEIRARMPEPPVAIAYPEQSLLETLGRYLKETAHVTLSPEIWREDRLPPYLRMNYHVIDAQGKTLRLGRDLQKIQRELAPKTGPILPAAVHAPAGRAGGNHAGEYHRDGLTGWDFPDLPASVEITARGTHFPGYPAIVDKEESVSLRLVDSAERARRLNRAGISRLLRLALPREMRYLQKNLPGLPALCQTYATLPTPAGDGAAGGDALPASADPCEGLREDLVSLIVEQTFLDDKAPIRTRAAFEETRKKHAPELMGVANELCRLTGEILEEYRLVASRLEELGARAAPTASGASAGAVSLGDWQQATRERNNPDRKHASRAASRGLADIIEQLDRLMFRGFLRATPAEQLPHLPRYLQAISRRLQKLLQSPDKDRRKMEQIIPLQQAHAALMAANLDERDAAMDLERQRWRLEELRVSLFAQELGTAEPVSVKRLQRQLGQ
uniref:ATP-dependent helicase HrpA n=1 Tax=Candidatus Kentrum sp. DK TaxID=2126562 RepID=A0A450S3X6_9GAMM|nr:MAG: ATP-dependent helicase HrpA [Candidatus Kentron sp. DK]